jgi:hypothetical protein
MIDFRCCRILSSGRGAGTELKGTYSGDVVDETSTAVSVNYMDSNDASVAVPW